jgi:hypothetical protein
MCGGPSTRRKSFKHKILPVTYCTPRITLQNRANTMIPIDRGLKGGRGSPQLSRDGHAAEPRPVAPKHRLGEFFAANSSDFFDNFTLCNPVPSVVKFVTLETVSDDDGLC